MLLLNRLRASLQTELDQFFARLHQTEVPRRIVGKSAFTQARAKLKPGAFAELHRLAIDYFYRHFPARRVEGFRLLAFDGSTVRLPRTEELGNYFGGFDDAANDRELPMGRLMQLCDVENQLCVALTLSPYTRGEGDLALEMLDRLGADDLVLSDRGFSDGALFAAIRARGAHFLGRVTEIFGCVEDFAQSGETERQVELRLSPKAQRRLQQAGLPVPDTLSVRLVKIALPGGHSEILMTSLLDVERYPRPLLADCYRRRWGIEESYKFLKCRAELDRFSGKTVRAVLQDAQATALLAAFTGIFCATQRAAVEAGHAGDRHPCQANRAQALANMKHTVFLLFVRPNFQELLDGLLAQIRRNVSLVRPDRHAPRSPAKRQPFAMAYKPLA